MPVTDLYGKHWSLTGEAVPDENSPDEAVFLPGRNVILLSKALIYCHLNGIPEVAMAPLEANPFPDATPEFFQAMAQTVSMAVGGNLRILTPYSGLHKVDVVRRGQTYPLSLTFSCINPVGTKHCGRCNKCAERQKGFQEANVPDPTEYHAL
jgi:7-cyano-7-deazaguanine synthase